MKFSIRKNPAVRQPFYFVLVAANGEPLMASEMFARKAHCRDMIDTIIDTMPLAKVTDDTGEV